MSMSFVPDDFQVPAVLETERFRLRMLSMNDVDQDYDAVMTSVDHLRNVFGPNSPWPQETMTLEEDLEDLEMHQREFETRVAFAYTVVRLDESQCLGCVYIKPTTKAGYDARVYTWVRKSAFEQGLDPVLFQAVQQWIERAWPFKHVAYPGREIDWTTWEGLPEL